MRVFGHGGEDVPPPPTTEDVRDEMTRDDPEYARLRRALHAARDLQTTKRATEELLERQRRQRRIDAQAEAWKRHANG